MKKKGLIVYKGKYGATEQYARWTGEDLGLELFTPDRVDKEQLAQSDIVLVGSSVYVGKLLIGDWLRENRRLLQNKKLFLFVVCATPASEEQKRREIIKAGVPLPLLDQLDIFFLPGRLVTQKLSWKDRLILRLGIMMEKDPARKKAMKPSIPRAPLTLMPLILAGGA